jgi:hypothetical protein
MPCTRACASRSCHRAFAPGQVLGALFALLAPVPLGGLEQALGGVRAPVQDHVLDPLAQLRVEVVDKRQGAGVDDAHVHAGGDRVLQEHRVDRLAHRLVAAEREADVGYAAGNVAQGKAPAQFAGGLDEGDGVPVVLVDAGRDREHVGVEDDVFGREPDAGGQQRVGAGADADLAFDGVGLAVLVEGHHHHRRAVPAHQPRLAQELAFALLERDRVDDALALQALETGLDHLPLRGVDHHRDPGDVGLGGDQLQEVDHRLLRVEQALVHVHVQHLGAGLDLLARDRDRLVQPALLDQLAEAGAAGDVGPLADVDEVGPWRDLARLQAGQAGVAGQGCEPAQAAASSTGSLRGGRPRIAPAIAAMCSGVVPQQPPTRLSRPASANSRRVVAMSSGLSS